MNAELDDRLLFPELYFLSLGLTYLIGKEIKGVKKCFDMKRVVENKECNHIEEGMVLLEGNLESDNYLFSS